MKMLDHPNIVKLERVIETPQDIVIVMELVPGGILFDQIKLLSKYSEMTVVKIMREVIAAVAYLHGKNIVHRDLKPENLLITTTDLDRMHVKVADFGLATLTKKDGQEFKLLTIAGTPHYMAPEVCPAHAQVSTADVDGPYQMSVDIWALGVIAFVLLSGRLPFKGKSLEALYQTIASQELQFTPERIWKKYSHEAKDFIRSTVVVDATRRLTISACAAHPWIAMKKGLRPRESFIANDDVAEALATLRAQVRAADAAAAGRGAPAGPPPPPRRPGPSTAAPVVPSSPSSTPGLAVSDMPALYDTQLMGHELERDRSDTLFMPLPVPDRPPSRDMAAPPWNLQPPSETPKIKLDMFGRPVRKPSADPIKGSMQKEVYSEADFGGLDDNGPQPGILPGRALGIFVPPPETLSTSSRSSSLTPPLGGEEELQVSLPADEITLEELVQQVAASGPRRLPSEIHIPPEEGGSAEALYVPPQQPPAPAPVPPARPPQVIGPVHVLPLSAPAPPHIQPARLPPLPPIPNPSPAPSPTPPPAQAPSPVPEKERAQEWQIGGVTLREGDLVTILFDFDGTPPLTPGSQQSRHALDIRQGEEVTLLATRKAPAGWLRCRNTAGRVGLVPASYCQSKAL